MIRLFVPVFEPVKGMSGKFGSAFQTQLLFDVLFVCADCIVAQVNIPELTYVEYLDYA